MKEKYIEVIISINGDIEKIEAFNFTGKECVLATQPLEDVLGKVTNRISKQEMNKRPPLQQERNIQRN